MGVTRTSRSIVMTANSDAVTGRLLVDSIHISGTGLTAGHAIDVQETSGARIVNHVFPAAQDSQEVFNPPQPKWVDGIKLSTSATGTWEVTVNVR